VERTLFVVIKHMTSHGAKYFSWLETMGKYNQSKQLKSDSNGMSDNKAIIALWERPDYPSLERFLLAHLLKLSSGGKCSRIAPTGGRIELLYCDKYNNKNKISFKQKRATTGLALCYDSLFRRCFSIN
jgi:hypothetical protein